MSETTPNAAPHVDDVNPAPHAAVRTPHAEPVEAVSEPGLVTTPEPAPEPVSQLAVEESADAPAEAGSDLPSAEPKGPPNISPAAVAALLAQHFPALFGAGRALPIKLRIQGDIQQRLPGVVNKKSLSIFLHRYTTSTAYLKALATQPQRLDLDGAPSGEVEAQHRDAAAAEAQRRKQMFDERRAAEREQQRQAANAERRARASSPAAYGVTTADGTVDAMSAAPAVPAVSTDRPAAPAERDRPAPRGPQPDRPPRRARPPAHTREGTREGTRHGPREGTREGARPDGRPDARRPPRPNAPGGARPDPRRETQAPRPPRDTRDEVAREEVSDSGEYEARRNRAALLRSFEDTKLTTANFCVLKRITEADLQTQLSLARQERQQRAAPRG